MSGRLPRYLVLRRTFICRQPDEQQEQRYGASQQERQSDPPNLVQTDFGSIYHFNHIHPVDGCEYVDGSDYASYCRQSKRYAREPLCQQTRRVNGIGHRAGGMTDRQLDQLIEVFDTSSTVLLLSADLVEGFVHFKLRSNDCPL